VDADAYRQQSRAGWDSMAGGWENRRDWLREMNGPVSDWLVERADPQPGQTFLEIASGTGDLSLAIAERVGPDGRVLSTDFAPEMVEAARRHGEGHAAGNVEHRVLDGERMDLDDDSVDGVICRFGYMLMADPAAALAHTRRVLRQGGPLAFAVWQGPDRNPWARVPAQTLMERGHLPPPDPGAPGMFAMAPTERIRELTVGAGFDEPEMADVAIEYRYADADDFWDSIVSLAGGLARAIAELTDAERAATRAAILERFEPFREPDGSYRAPGAAWGVLTR
jgi:SAM-dependent methyltransferase